MLKCTGRCSLPQGLLCCANNRISLLPNYTNVSEHVLRLALFCNWHFTEFLWQRDLSFECNHGFVVV